MATSSHPSLMLFGPAHLRYAGRPVKIGAKGLAILYVLALEGNTRREKLADLLWDHPSAANNLRVQLHRLRSALADIDLVAFPAGEDPLQLPSHIDVAEEPARPDEEPLQGLDDLSPAFQEWLESQRTRLARTQGNAAPPVRQDLVDRISRGIRPPFGIVLVGPPGSGRRHFARAIGDQLGLPVLESPEGTVRAVRYLDVSTVHAPRAAEHIASLKDGIWIIAQSSYATESELVLRLRQLFSADRMRYLELAGLSWADVRSHLLRGVPFEEAARIYLESGGYLGYLKELLELRPSEGFGSELPLPQHVRAAYLLEALRLPEAARHALDLLCVHPSPISPALMRILDVTPHLDTLEVAGWLRFDSTWRFRHGTARKVIYYTLHEGRKIRYHARFAETLSTVESEYPLAAAFHRVMSGEPWEPGKELTRIASSSPDWAQAILLHAGRPGFGRPPVATQVQAGKERALLLDRHHEVESNESEQTYTLVRRFGDNTSCFAEFTLPTGPTIVRIDYRVLSENSFGVGLDARSAALEVHLLHGDRRDRRIVFADVDEAEEMPDGSILYPARRMQSVHVLCDHRTLRFESHAEACVVEITPRAFELVSEQTGHIHALDVRWKAQD